MGFKFQVEVRGVGEWMILCPEPEVDSVCER